MESVRQRAAGWYRRAAEQAFEGNDLEAAPVRAAARPGPAWRIPRAQLAGELDAGAHQG